jgi:hypothetical protein
MANVHVTLVGTLVQVALVWLVVVGQLPQFDARMLYWISGQSGIAETLQSNVKSESTAVQVISPIGGKGAIIYVTVINISSNFTNKNYRFTFC